METKKIVLIPASLLKLKKDTQVPLHVVRDTFLKKIIKFGGFPLILPTVFNKTLIDTYYELCGGILFTGGSDYDPSTYSEKLHAKTEINEPERDLVEQYIFKKALSEKKPILGVCRGAQGLAIASGGKLIQHIEDLGKDVKHGVSEEKGYDELFETQNLHLVKLTLNSRINNMLNEDEILLNTAHHQAIYSVGNDFKITGKTKDGITEIIEHIDPNYFCFGFQCHIEAMDGLTDRIFEEFIRAITA